MLRDTAAFHYPGSRARGKNIDIFLSPVDDMIPAEGSGDCAHPRIWDPPGVSSLPARTRRISCVPGDQSQLGLVDIPLLQDKAGAPTQQQLCPPENHLGLPAILLSQRLNFCCLKERPWSLCHSSADCQSCCGFLALTKRRVKFQFLITLLNFSYLGLEFSILGGCQG